MRFPVLTNQSSQYERAQLLENNGVARLVSLENLITKKKSEEVVSTFNWEHSEKITDQSDAC